MVIPACHISFTHHCRCRRKRYFQCRTAWHVNYELQVKSIRRYRKSGWLPFQWPPLVTFQVTNGLRFTTDAWKLFANYKYQWRQLSGTGSVNYHLKEFTTPSLCKFFSNESLRASYVYFVMSRWELGTLKKSNEFWIATK